MVYCFNRCSYVKKKTKFVKCTCSSENKYNFKVYAVEIRDEETFQIRSLSVVHNCGHQHQNNKASALYLAERYLEDWRENQNWDLKAFIKRVNRELQCKVAYQKCYNAKRIAMKNMLRCGTMLKP